MKLKHFTTQAAIDAQSSIALVQGMGWSGQQSCTASETDASAEGMADAAPIAAGCIASESAIRKANVVRKMPMTQP